MLSMDMDHGVCTAAPSFQNPISMKYNKSLSLSLLISIRETALWIKPDWRIYSMQCPTVSGTWFSKYVLNNRVLQQFLLQFFYLNSASFSSAFSLLPQIAFGFPIKAHFQPYYQSHCQANKFLVFLYEVDHKWVNRQRHAPINFVLQIVVMSKAYPRFSVKLSLRCARRRVLALGLRCWFPSVFKEYGGP